MDPPGPPAPRARASSRRRRWSLAGRLGAGLLAGLVLTALAVAGVVAWHPSPLLAALVTVGVGVAVSATALARTLGPLEAVLRAVADGIRSFRDRDFGVRLVRRRDDELGELVGLYNEVGELLQQERQALLQRELLLQTALDRSPAAILLFGPTDRVLYANREARLLLLGGEALEGRSFAEIAAGTPERMREILASGEDGLFTVPADPEPETYHVSRRAFRLNYRRYTLLLLRRLTGELGRQEAEIWKKVIRVISHELNNSLAPVSSLVHSARALAADSRRADRLEEIFATIRERLDHLQRFLEGYARFARLPRPRRQEVEWTSFLLGFEAYPGVVIAQPLPAAPGWFDPAQLRQVVLNLLKNATEASAEGAEIGLRIRASREGGTYLQVADRGRGMDDETLRRALLPFYTTKQGGSGLGLALCREIVEAHGGKLSLQSTPGEGTLVTCWLPPRGPALEGEPA